MGVVEDFQLSFYEEVSKISNRAGDISTEVWLVRDTRDDRLYVKKTLKVSEENVYQTIMNYENKYPGKGRLEGIPKIFALVRQEEELVVVEEYINHPTLRKVMESDAPSTEELIVIFKEICTVMKQLHTINPPVIHRDIKPDNIMVNMDAVRGKINGTKVFVIDWNAAREYSYVKERDTQLMGTFDFAAPEQLGYGQSDVRTDIFGVGATLEYCMREVEAKKQFTNSSFVWNSLRTISKKAKSLSPNDRYSCDLHMIEAFDELLGTGKTSNTEQATDFSMNYEPQGHSSKQSYTLPGFRSKKLWKILVAILGYLMIFVAARDAKLNDYTGFWVIYSKVTYFILLICHVFWFCNYMGVQDSFKWTKSGSKTIRVLGHSMIVVAIWIIWAVVLALPEFIGLI